MKKYIKWLGALAAFVLICASAAVITQSSETLAEYAEREPEIAYAKQETKSEETTATKPASSENVTSSKEGGHALGESETITEEIGETVMNETEMNPLSQTEANNTERITYQPDFYYEPLSEDMKKRITGLSYKEDCPIPYEDLRYVSILYVNFKGNTSTGELICNKAIAQDLVEIFYELYQADYQIEQIRLVDEYNADDNLSMQDNNSSCFNYRTIAGTSKISMHGQGLAIDINPFFNPYVTYHNGETQVAPVGAESYVDRSQPFAYKIDENDLCYKLFTEHGFHWGGHWNSSKDYQHFEKKID